MCGWSLLTFAGRVLSWVLRVCCHRAFVDISMFQKSFLGVLLEFIFFLVAPKFFSLSVSWVWNFFSWVFRASNFFSRGYYFVGPKFFQVWVFRGSEIFCLDYSEDPKFFLAGISWVQYFFSFFFLLIRDSKIFSCWIQKYISNYVIFSKSISIIANCLC